MTRYYIYIEAGPILDESSRFYRVAVGSSRVGQRELQFLQSYAADHHHYFQLRTLEVSQFCVRALKSIGRDCMDIIDVNARDFVRDLKNQTRPTLSANTLNNTHNQRFQLDLNYRISCNLNRLRH